MSDCATGEPYKTVSLNFVWNIFVTMTAALAGARGGPDCDGHRSVEKPGKHGLPAPNALDLVAPVRTADVTTTSVDAVLYAASREPVSVRRPCRM